jgi:hypothetical protein
MTNNIESVGESRHYYVHCDANSNKLVSIASQEFWPYRSKTAAINNEDYEVTALYAVLHD